MTRPEPIWHYYYLYGLERAGVIVGKRFLGDHDWYQEGARAARRRAAGGRARGAADRPSAAGPARDPAPCYDMSMLDTCFAILFLKRAALEPKQPLLPGPVVTPR